MASSSASKLDYLYEEVAVIFEQAQASLANHKKNCVALFKLHTKASQVTQAGKNGAKLVGEKAFQDVFLDMVSRVLLVKKGPATADRIVKYVGAFVKFMNEKAQEAKTKNPDEEGDETPTTRFVARLLNWLLQGFLAKNKNVRYRCIQIICETISHLGEIDEDAYNELRSALMDRLNDKETLIRAHAVIALSKLISSEDPDDVEQGEKTILQTLLEAVSTDPAAEVRRAALINVPLSPATLDIILSRTRDVDPVTRKLVYTGVLQPKLGHARHLTIAQREQIVKDGLGDREPGVRVAAGKLVTSWFDAVVTEGQAVDSQDGWEGDDGGMMKGLVQFLSLFDVVGPGVNIAVDATLSIFTTRPDVPDAFVFPDAFWKELSPESSVLARVFVEYCTSSKKESRLESASLPVVTAFAFHIQDAYNNMLEVLQEIETAKLLRAGLDDQEVDEELEEELAKREVVMNELLQILLKLDYADEIGRRKVFSVVKNMLAHPELPPGLIERCLDVLKEIMPSERDLIRMIVEIVVQLREGDDDAENADEPPLDDNQSDVSQTTIRRDKSARQTRNREEMSAEERRQADLMDIRCLMLCIAMLERINGTFEDNSTLEGILGDLIIPSVKRKELAMREKALVSLGLCCLIAKNMALSSFQLFLSQAQNAPPELKIQVLRVIMDLLIMYDQEFFGRSEETAARILDFLLQLLEAEEDPNAQAVIVTGLCKLLLAGMITEPKVLTCLALMYISPTTVDHQEVRQCLSYFFPVYSYSSPANQNRMQSIFMPTFDLAVRMHEEMDEDQDMISPYQFGLLMVDWTNPHKAAEIAVDTADAFLSHVNLSVEILVGLYDSDRTPDQQKSLCQLLGQLHLETGLDKRSILKLNVLLSYHEEQCPFENSTIEKLFDRFKNQFSNMFAEELKDLNPQQYMDDELRELYQRIGVDVPGEGEDGEVRSRSRGSRRAQKVDEDEDEEEEEEDAEDEEEQVHDDGEVDGTMEDEPTEQVGSEEVENKEPEVEENHGSDDASERESDVPDEESRKSSVTPPPPPPPKRTTRKSAPKRAPPKSKAKAKPRNAQEDSESQVSDEENIPPVALTATPKKKKGVKRDDPPSGALNSPVTRKRTRVKAPLKPVPKETTPMNTDSDENSPSPKPVKPVRQVKGRQTRLRSQTTKPQGRKLPAKAPPPPESSEGEDADEVASSLASQRSTPELQAKAAASDSDDFGGFSD